MPVSIDMESNEDENAGHEDDLETTIEVIHIQHTTKMNATKSSRPMISQSSDGSRDSESQQTHTTTTTEEASHPKEKKTKWKKLKTGFAQGTKSLGSRLIPSGAGGRSSHRNTVQEICILPSNGLSGECFGEEEKKEEEKEKKEAVVWRLKGGRRGGRGGGGHQRKGSDDSLVFASRLDSATSTKSRSSIVPSVDTSSSTNVVIYDAEYDGRL